MSQELDDLARGIVRNIVSAALTKDPVPVPCFDGDCPVKYGRIHLPCREQGFVDFEIKNHSWSKDGELKLEYALRPLAQSLLEFYHAQALGLYLKTNWTCIQAKKEWSIEDSSSIEDIFRAIERCPNADTLIITPGAWQKLKQYELPRTKIVRTPSKGEFVWVGVLPEKLGRWDRDPDGQIAGYSRYPSATYTTGLDYDVRVAETKNQLRIVLGYSNAMGILDPSLGVLIKGF